MSKKQTTQKPKKYCPNCERERPQSEFYTSNSTSAKDGRHHFCKKCVTEFVDFNNIEDIKQLLMELNKPFIYDLWATSVRESGENSSSAFGLYLKNVYLNHKNLTWKNSKFESDKEDDGGNAEIPKNNNLTFTVTDQMIEKWGSGYEVEEYRQFERKYSKLINNYGEKTALHTEGLLSYIRFRVKEEMATARGDVREAKEWGGLASKAAQDAKINVSQLSKSDISGGVDVLSQLFEAVETEVGIIPLLPKVLEQPYDDVDLTIWANINYYRKLEDKPMVPYKDIWNFYDEMLEEYFNSAGYNEEQIKEHKEKRNNVFRDLGKVYIEPLYHDEGDENG